MSNHMQLLGAEDVRAAANTMRHAAEAMQSAASSFYETMQQHQRFMDDWLQRYEQALKASVPPSEDPPSLR